MSEMVERVARAICTRRQMAACRCTRHKGECLAPVFVLRDAGHEDQARAAIAAMKGPSEAAFCAEIDAINRRHGARVSELLAANNAEVEKRLDAERWAAFGRAVMKQHKDGDCGDVDGEWLQGIGVQTGVLQIVEAKEPCAEEGCACAATCGDWPVDCYRVVTP